MLQATDILVPVDFSACSINAVKAALAIASPEGDLTLLHVIDEDFLTEAVGAGLGSREEIQSKMRERAEGDFAQALDLKMIVMGVRGRSISAEEWLFGSTAEKVLRGSKLPVLCIPF